MNVRVRSTNRIGGLLGGLKHARDRIGRPVPSDCSGAPAPRIEIATMLNNSGQGRVVHDRFPHQHIGR
jgi:hypothetical protein